MSNARSGKGRPARIYESPAQERQRALEQLRKELRHQRAENNAIQASRLFREFRLVADQQSSSNIERFTPTLADVRTAKEPGSCKNSQGAIANKQAPSGSANCEARLTEGIWSTAGQPYSCLGKPEEVCQRKMSQKALEATQKVFQTTHYGFCNDEDVSWMAGSKRSPALVCQQAEENIQEVLLFEQNQGRLMQKCDGC